MKIIFQLLVYNLICFVALAQFNVTIKTPKGTDVDALDYIYLYNGDYNQTEWESEDNFWLTLANVDSSQVTLLAHSSIGYNCHSYAWHVSEGGNNVWVNDLNENHNDIDNVNKYWDDGSYVETTEANHHKVFYHPETQFDHSAVTTSQSGWFVSKWTNGPLVRHRYDNCPYWNSAVNLTYYKLSKPTISGIFSALCNNSLRTFVSDINDENFTYDWASNSTYLTEINEDYESYTVRGTSSIGYSTISLAITAPSGATSSNLDFVGVNTPYPGNLSFSLCNTGGTPVPFMCPNTHYHLYLVNDDGCSLSNYTWSIPDGWTQNYTWDNMVSVYTGSTPGGMVEVYANTCCGVNTKVYIGYLPGEYDCGRSYSLLFSPNPASGETTLSIEPTSEDTEFDEDSGWDLEVYTQNQLLKEKKTSLKGNSTKIQTQDWTEGIYIVRVKYKDEVLDGKLVVKK